MTDNRSNDMTRITAMVRLTDDRGMFLPDPIKMEPEPSSVVLTDGEFGNAWQRYFSDGLWHRGKQAKTWEQMLAERDTRRNMLLVYDAPVRPSPVCPGCGYADNHDSAQCPSMPVGVRA